MEYLPVFLNVQHRKCLLIGGGEVALRKANLLKRANASIHVVAHAIDPDLMELLEQDDHQYRIGEFTEDDLQGAALVIAATDNPQINERVSQLAGLHNIPVNVVDQPALCSMIFPAIVDRSPVVVAISSSGSSPILGRKLKEQLEIAIPAATGALANLLGNHRDTVKSRITSFDARIRFWENVLDSDIPELVYAGNHQAAETRITSMLEESASSSAAKGEVYLVGAGPGDPDLLTLRALRLMQKADVVLHDRLVSPEIMEKIRPDARKIDVGKERARHLVPQETINDMLVRLAADGKRVLRLKGGDPFIFGRGGEEMETLIDHGIPFQIVPGITAASGCASYAGIPLTHRDYAQSVQFLTGHFKDETTQPHWPALIQANQTLVFYMGLANLENICRQLVSHGLNHDTPAAVVQKGTTPQQLVIAGTLETLPELVRQHSLPAHSLIIIGNVVLLRKKLDWYKSENPVISSLPEKL